MNFKYVSLLCLIAFSGVASATARSAKPVFWQNKFSMGPSAPTKGANELLADNGFQMVRATGGATVSVGFLDQSSNDASILVGGMTITAYSKSGKGAVFVHGANLSPNDKPTELKKLEGMLRPNKSVKVVFAKAIRAEEFDVTLEGFGNDDASVVIDVDLATDGHFKYRASEDLVNPVESGDDGGSGNYTPVAGPTPSRDVYGGQNTCPDGSRGTTCQESPDGTYHGPNLCPNGQYGTTCNVCPDGSYGC